MYIVRNKATQEIIHSNPAPLSQNLAPAEVYHAFDAETMEIGRAEGALPEHWDIDADGAVYELPLSELVARGKAAVPTGEKLEGDRFVPLTEEDRLAAGDLTIAEIMDRENTRLRAEVESLFRSGRTAANGYRIDGLTREKMSVTVLFRRAGEFFPVDLKNTLEDERIIYPNNIFDEMEQGVQAVQVAYYNARTALDTALQSNPPDLVEARAVSVRDHVTGNAILFTEPA